MELDYFLICGLGNLGQHCVIYLTQFGVKIVAIESHLPSNWELANIPNLVDKLIVGDCRQNNILEQAFINQCRAALIVTDNERVNTETALAIRQLNSQTRLVIRSSKTNLNQLLAQQLGNYIAFDPTQLPAPSFAFAALGTDILGVINIENQWLRVVQTNITLNHKWCNSRYLNEINNRERRLLSYNNSYVWEDGLIRERDSLVYIEIADHSIFRPIFDSSESNKFNLKLYLSDFYKSFWQLTFQQKMQRVAVLSFFIVTFLLVLGIFLFHLYYPKLTVIESFYMTAILILGGYADLFDDFQDAPGLIKFFGLFLTVIGTAFVGVLYALLTEALLSSKFQFSQRRPSTPKQDHIIIIGLGRIGTQVSKLLLQFNQLLLGITNNYNFKQNLLPQMSIIFGNFFENINKINIQKAKSVVITTNDEILNLEIALMINSLNPETYLIIRTFEQRLSQHLSHLLPNANIICAYAVAAEAFVGAAFGENILSLCRLHKQTILVTEYIIETGDTLNGLLLADMAYGYGVVPIFYHKPPNYFRFMPSDDLILHIGDRLVVLATIEGLKKIEHGLLDTEAKSHFIYIEKIFNEDASFEGANTISRISGCQLGIARDSLKNIPATLNIPLYKQQAKRLIKSLSKLQIKAHLIN
jgi:Trk K+ transport system NAD-binding subunit